MVGRSNDEVGRRLEAEIAEEIARLGLGDVLVAEYLREHRVIRVARREGGGAPATGGIDYPVDAGADAMREHLELYRRLRDVWE